MKKEIEYLGQKLIVDSDGSIDGYYGYENKFTNYVAIMMKDQEGKYRYVYVHRLVALAFCNPPDDWKYLQVDHKNGDRTDNRAKNLRWVTRKENNSTKKVITKHRKNWHFTDRSNQRLKATKNGKIRFFKTGREAARKIGCSSVLVYNAANKKGSARRAKGWELEWVSVEEK